MRGSTTNEVHSITLPHAPWRCAPSTLTISVFGISYHCPIARAFTQAGRAPGGGNTETVADALAVPPDPVQVKLKVLVLVSTPVDSLPEVALVPDQPPEGVQEVTLVDDQVSVDVPPLAIDVGFAASDTVGTGGAGDVVVKSQVKSAASALPAASFAAVVRVAVYCVLAARAADGVNVAVLPLTFTVPVTVAPPVGFRVKLAVVSVEVVIPSEKVAETEEFSAMPVAAAAGDVEDTVGGVVSGSAAVVNCQM